MYLYVYIYIYIVDTMAASDAYGKDRKAGVSSVMVSSITAACKGHTVYV